MGRVPDSPIVLAPQAPSPGPCVWRSAQRHGQERQTRGVPVLAWDLLGTGGGPSLGIPTYQGAQTGSLEQNLRLETGERERDSLETRSLAQQNVELRRRLEEEQAAYKRKLQAYQEGQQRQAQLVQKLQAKVVQYKKRCGEVEQQLLERSTELEQERLSVSLTAGVSWEEESSNELENALIRLEEEQQRSASLTQVNVMLREQLDQANAANQALSEDLRKLTSDWSKARDELEQRESEWRREEE
ncbi:LOW QUALITY PROTEIN: rootletin-like, partial [Anomaloglossus baeobatrachus]